MADTDFSEVVNNGLKSGDFGEEGGNEGKDVEESNTSCEVVENSLKNLNSDVSNNLLNNYESYKSPFQNNYNSTENLSYNNLSSSDNNLNNNNKEDNEEENKRKSLSKDKKERKSYSKDRRSYSKDRKRRSYSRERNRRRRHHNRSYSRDRKHKRRYHNRSYSKDRHYRDNKDKDRDNRDKLLVSDEINLNNYYYNKDKDKENYKDNYKDKEKEERRRKDIEEAQRDDLTVLVSNMGLSAGEREIYELFSEQAGRVRDVQLVRDQRSGRSKGIAYVEFYTQESVIKALSLTGSVLGGQGIRVQSSQAEKNRAARAARQQQESRENSSLLLVSGAAGPLLLSEDQLRRLFAPFGHLLDVTTIRSENSTNSALLKYSRRSEAKEALSVMNNFDVLGQTLKVSYYVEKKDKGLKLRGDLAENDILLDDDQGLISGSSNKIALMKKLQRSDEVTSNLVLYNMYNLNEVNENELNDIKLDILNELNKYGNVINIFFYPTSYSNDNENNNEVGLGNVYIKYKYIYECENAYKNLINRYFNGNLIKLSYISDELFLLLYHKSK